MGGDYHLISNAVITGLRKPPEKAVELARLRRIVKLVSEEGTEYYIALGTKGDYLLIPRLFCSCKDFELNVVVRRLKNTCYHLIALELAMARGLIREVRLGREEVKDVIYEVIYGGRSRILRKKLLNV